jgi:hypothetical protein
MKRELDRRRDRMDAARLGWIAGAVALVLTLLGTGCKHETTGTAAIEPTGTYNLVSVSGKPVPCPVAHEGSPTVKSGSFVIRADGTCTSRIAFSTPTSGEMVREVKAKYTREGSKLTFQWEGAGTTTGRVEGASFTMENEGSVFAYRK